MLRPQKTYGTGICPKHGEFTRTNANQGENACPHLSCCQERRVARVKVLRKKRKGKS